MNILILSVGTRVQLVRYFQKSKRITRVVTTDCSKYAPALYEGSRYYIVPRMDEVKYIPFIFEICEKENIDAILPLHEDELVLMAGLKEQFEAKSICVVISPAETIQLCRDKYKLTKYMWERGIACVPTYVYEFERETIEKIPFPVLVKERYGAGSSGMLKVNCKELLEAYNKNVESPIVIQPYLEVQEFGVDVYVDMISGEIINIFIKKKIRMRAGETEKSVSVREPRIIDLIKKIISVMKLRGPIDVDIFLYQNNFILLEINPRFGGGYIHAHQCGVDFIDYIIKNISGKKNVPDIGNYKAGQVLLKYTDAIMLNEE